MNTFFPPNVTSSGTAHTLQSEFSIRDHFAGLAMQSLMQVYWDNVSDYPDAVSLIKSHVEAAYEYADAMLEQRRLKND